MHAETDFDRAYLYLLAHGSGAFYLSDGSMVSGDLFDFESETDSPNGIPYVSLLTPSGVAVDVYEDDFVRATFPDEE